MKKNLTKHPSIPPPHGPVCLIILDGVGIGPKDNSNACYIASTPFLDTLENAPTY